MQSVPAVASCAGHAPTHIELACQPIFALGGDDHEMPILPTRQAPVVAKAKPSTLQRLAQHLLHITKYGSKPKPPEPNNKKHRAAIAFEAGTDDGEDGETDGEMLQASLGGGSTR